MGARGPAPTPSRILALRGSWRGNLNPAEPRPEPARPETPSWLTAESKAIFDALADQLHAVSVLTGVDQEALARYARLVVRYRRAEQFLEEKGEFYVQKTPGGEVKAVRPFPQAKLSLALAVELLRLEREFGLTPAARARLSAPVPDEGDGDEGQDYFSPPAKSG